MISYQIMCFQSRYSFLRVLHPACIVILLDGIKMANLILHRITNGIQILVEILIFNKQPSIS